MRQYIAAAIRAVGDREFKFTGATDQLARDGHVLLPGGMELGDYRRNPIILWMHDPHNPVTRCTQIGIADGALRGTGQFPPPGTTALADEICGLVKSGVVNAVSVGFEPIDTEPLDPKKPRGGLRILTSSLMEISLVAVAADTNALITERAHSWRTTRTMTNHVLRASEAMDAAGRHCHDCGRHMRRGDDEEAAAAHGRIGGHLNTAQRCFRELGDKTTPQLRWAHEAVNDAQRHHRRLGDELGLDDGAAG